VQPPSSGVKAGAWQPVKSAHATSGLHLSSRGGEAAAPALIRETSHSNGEASAVKPHLETAVELPSRKREEAHKPVAVAQPVEEELSAPAFSTSKEAEPAPKSSHTGLILVLVLAVCAVGGYFGWTKFAAKPVVVPQQSAPEQVPPAAAVDGSSAAPAKPSAIITPAETPAPAQHDAGSAPEEEAAADVVVHNLAASKSGAAPPKEAAAPIVVKSSTPQPARLDTNAPAPQVTSMVSNSGDQAISGIVGMTTSVPKPVLQTVRVSQGISQGFLIKKVQPLYPVQARQLRLEGAVQLVATIGKDGVPKDLKVAGGHPVLARAAVEAVQQWRYKAYTLNGSPVEFETQVTVNFKLP
jgi:TonB family protein